MLASIGHTPMVQLRRVVPAGYARILIKLEGQNPTGSMKDRMAKAVIERAVLTRRLAVGGRVVEYTGGSNRSLDGALEEGAGWISDAP